MFRLKYPMLLFLISVCVMACAQENYGVTKIMAFRSLRMPGNIPVDENGNSLFKGPDTIHTVYIETTGKGIVWDKAWIGGKTFTIVAMPLPATAYNAGIAKENNRQMILTPGKGTKPWLLELQPLDTAEKLPVGSLKTGEILLRGKYGTKVITQIIKKQTELEPLPMY